MELVWQLEWNLVFSKLAISSQPSIFLWQKVPPHKKVYAGL